MLLNIDICQFQDAKVNNFSKQQIFLIEKRKRLIVNSEQLIVNSCPAGEKLVNSEQLIVNNGLRKKKLVNS
jgi:hypothetical protein